jgi:hypothetical protein
MNTRAFVFMLTVLAGLTGSALSFAFACGGGRYDESTMSIRWSGFGGPSNPAATHRDAHVPGATLPPNSTFSHPTAMSPVSFETSTPPTLAPPAPMQPPPTPPETRQDAPLALPGQAAIVLAARLRSKYWHR